MRPRHLPRLWLMTDERQGDALLPAVRALPRGSGVVFRHLASPPAERRGLFQQVRAICRARRLALVTAPPHLRGGDGTYITANVFPSRLREGSEGWARARDRVHRSCIPGAHPQPLPRAGGGQRRARLLVSVHNSKELAAARRLRPDLVFVSPVFSTRTHPGARTLGRTRFAGLATRAPAPVIALGGMTARRACGLPAHGWAAIDALTPSSPRA